MSSSFREKYMFAIVVAKKKFLIYTGGTFFLFRLTLRKDGESNW